MKRKVIYLFVGICLVGGLALVWIDHSATRYNVLLIGVDGASWDLVHRLASENRIPNLQKLINTGSGGYLNSIMWKKKSGGGQGLFSPIVWASIATGKLPSKHGVEDFKLPLPDTLNFRMGYDNHEEGNRSSVLFPYIIRDSFQIVLRAKAPPKVDSAHLSVFFNDRPLGNCALKSKYDDCHLEIDPELIRWQKNQIVFRYSSGRKLGPQYVAADIESFRVYDSHGQLILDYFPARDEHLFQEGWIPNVTRTYALASSFHLRSRTLWEIVSNFNKRVAVIGWWETWPAFPVNGYLVSSHVGLHGERNRELRRAGQNFLDVLPDLVYPPEFLSEVKSMYTPREEMIPEYSRRFFEPGKCACIGSKQEEITLERFWQDKYFSKLSTHLLDEKGEFDLFAVYFRGTDTMAHQFIGFSEHPELVEEHCGGLEGCDKERIRRILDNYYTFVDAQIGELLKRRDRRTVTFIVTDHGEFAQGKKGVHKNNGFIIAEGPIIRRHTFTTASVLDVVPTILYVLNLPVAQDMDGDVMKGVFDKKFLSERPVNYIDSYDTTIKSNLRVVTNQELEERDTEELKALGYIN